MTLNVLIVGAGAYTCGRGTPGFGTLLPALFQASKRGLVGKITVAATRPDSADTLGTKAKELNRLLGTAITPRFVPESGRTDPHAFEKALGAEKFDCALVAIPDPLHFEVTRTLIQNGLHCFVVKPLCPTVDEVRELIRLQEAQGVHCVVDFHKRFDEANLGLRRMIRENRIGDPLYALVEYSQRRKIPLELFRSWASTTNVFQYLGVHYVDLIHYCTRYLPVSVVARGQKGLLAREGLDVDDSIQAMIDWRHPVTNGVMTSLIATNWVDPNTSTAMSDQKIKFVGTAGRLESDQKHRGLHTVTEASGAEDLNPYFSDYQHEPDDEALAFRGYGYRSVEQFLEDCRDIRSKSALAGLRPTFREALVSTAVVEAVNESLRDQGRKVVIEQNEVQVA